MRSSGQSSIGSDARAAGGVTKPPPGLYLHVPGLLGPMPRGAPDLLSPDTAANLTALLSRAGRQPGGRVSAFLRYLDAVAGGALAAYGAHLEGAASYWMRAAPIRLEADRDTLVLLGPEVLRLTDDEAGFLCRELNGHFAADGIVFHALAADNWLVELECEAPDLRLQSLEEVRGRRLFEQLPGGADASRWIRHLNELQMVLHASGVSESREQAGLPRVNGVWLWSGGRLPDAFPPVWDRVASDDVVHRGVARLAGQSAESPSDPVTLCRYAAAGEAVLVSLPGAPRPTDGPGFQEWEQWLQELDRSWMGPFRAALRDGIVPALHICGRPGLEWHCRRWDRLRVWRPGRTLASLIEVDR